MDDICADTGPTLRDWLAMSAMQQIDASFDSQSTQEEIEAVAKFCYRMADAMLKARG